ncbi:MAG TPA: hypothetical protein VM260_12100, partial [Pirellula sp.]|nr:hypothetical protein [Pirellula sp.]
SEANTGGGGCVCHAHLHLFPMVAPVDEWLQLLSGIWSNRNPLASHRAQRPGTPYLYYRGQDGRDICLEQFAKPVGSQFIRRKVAGHVGNKAWDWKIEVQTRLRQSAIIPPPSKTECQREDR